MSLAQSDLMNYFVASFGSPLQTLANPAVTPLIKLISSNVFTSEAAVETHAITSLQGAGYEITQRKSGNKKIDSNWPSKNTPALRGVPDMLLLIPGSDRPACVWENKAPGTSAREALQEAQFYIEGLHQALPSEPSLPRIAVGFNGVELLVSYYTHGGKWVSIKCDGQPLKDEFIVASLLRNGISSTGAFNAVNGPATSADLRAILPKLKTLYRVIPQLSSGRAPIDFTIAMLTLKLLVEQHPDWGTWAEQPAFSPGTNSRDHGIGERLEVLTRRVLGDPILRGRYGDIFEFKEQSDHGEVGFSFIGTLHRIEKGRGYFDRLFEIIDNLPPLTDADFDVFGEVYQFIGDDATKRALGEFFTGRHIISGILPILFARASLGLDFSAVRKLRIADIACGTGGFLTEFLRLTRRTFKLSQQEVRRFAESSFFGYDIGPANASRARVNMYFAGDGFSVLRGGFDSLSPYATTEFPTDGFDIVVTNPPYGKSTYGRSEEAFLTRVLDVLKPGGWGLLVLPTGVLENPRSAAARFELLRRAAVTDVISLPRHAFAPYTQQRTGVVIFRKRKEPTKVGRLDWDGLVAATGQERIAMFIVDNDGYANSDKRYPTSRRDSEGRWLHNDLREWIDSSGVLRPSKLYSAHIDEIAPPPATTEFEEPLGPKYRVLRVGEMREIERGVALLPDLPLRLATRHLSMSEFINRAQQVLGFVRGSVVTLGQPFQREVVELLNSPIDYPSGTYAFHAKLVDLFTTMRGDQGLTEAVIYNNYSLHNGIPVYGGGATIPKFRIDRGTRKVDGNPITVYSAPAIVVSMDGTAGAMQVVEHGEFSANHHARVLASWGDSLNLHWFVQQHEQPLKALASNKSGSATLTNAHLENLEVEIPPPAIRNAIGELRRALVHVRNEFAG